MLWEMEGYFAGRTKLIGGPNTSWVPPIGQPFFKTSSQYANHQTFFFSNLWSASVLRVVRGGFSTELTVSCHTSYCSAFSTNVFFKRYHITVGDSTNTQSNVYDILESG
jgi:hypothetical protein